MSNRDTPDRIGFGTHYHLTRTGGPDVALSYRDEDMDVDPVYLSPEALDKLAAWARAAARAGRKKREEGS